MSDANVEIRSVSDKEGRAHFVDLGRAFTANLPHYVPQLRSEQLALVDPVKNPFFEHADVELFIAYRSGKPVGRISAHIDHLAHQVPAEQGMGPGTGMFGYFDADDQDVVAALLSRAEDWLRAKGMTRVLGPISLSIWEEPGLLIRGHDHAPMLLMGHHPEHYRAMIESQGYTIAKRLLTYELDISKEFPPIVQRIVRSGEKNPRITMRRLDKSNIEAEISTMLEILNDAWSGNWGFVPLTEREVSETAKKMKPILHPALNRIADLDGEPVAFMITLPDMNDVLQKIDGKLLPFGWLALLQWLRKPRGSGMRVPLMGVRKELHNSRLASQLAFMMISDIRRSAAGQFDSNRGEIGWILDDNQGMIAIADAIESKINREYAIFEKQL